MYYTLSEVLTIVKQNIGMRDLPKPITDADLQWRLEHVVLKLFSEVYPYKSRFLLGEADRLCKPYSGVPVSNITSYSSIYRVPKHIYQEHHILDVTYVDIQRPSGYNDLYVPQGMFADPASTMAAVASMQAVAAISKNFTHALTWDFKQPDIIVLYNGWTGGTYEVEITMDHDPSLSTIDPGATDFFLQLAEYDLGAYIYQKLRRVQNVDVGIGTVELGLDFLADYADKRRQLLDEASESAALDQLHVQFF